MMMKKRLKKRQSEREGEDLTMMSKLENEDYRIPIMTLRILMCMRVRQLKVILCLRRFREEVKSHLVKTKIVQKLMQPHEFRGDGQERFRMLSGSHECSAATLSSHWWPTVPQIC